MTSTPFADWIRVLDEELVTTHLGTVDVNDTYHAAKRKLQRLIDWHVSVALDPAVNGGWKLFPENPTSHMLEQLAGVRGKQSSPRFYELQLYDYKRLWRAVPKRVN